MDSLVASQPSLISEPPSETPVSNNKVDGASAMP